MEELVILVDKKNNQIGTALKATIHQEKTPLHRAFSCFIFNEKKELLIQQRAFSKKTWPGVWSNSVCGHPLPNEKYEDTVKRRTLFELGLKIPEFFEILPNFRYRASRDGIEENEICPVWIGFSNDLPTINPSEVENYKYIPWNNFLENLETTYKDFSIWSKQEAILLSKNKKFQELLASFGKNKKDS